MGFAPNTTIQLFKGISWDNTYENTMYFSSESSQNSYFSNRSNIVVLNEQYRVEATNNTIKVEKPYSEIFKINYMRFRNTSYQNKWFYAFVTNVEYVNESCCRIYYELDVMQTWLPNVDYTLGQCLVEREHCDDDVIENQRYPESFEIGDYVSTAFQYSGQFDHLRLYAMATNNYLPEGNYYPPQVISGIPQPVYIYPFGEIREERRDVLEQGLRAFISLYATEGKAEEIVGIFTSPQAILYDETTGKCNFEPLEWHLECPDITFDKNYTPRNNKLRTAPYVKMLVKTPTDTMELNYEDFNFVPSISMLIPFSPSAKVMAYPRYYKGVAENFLYAVSCGGFPLCAWTTEYYQNWIGRNWKAMTLDVSSNLASTIPRMVTPMLTSAFAPTAPNATNAQQLYGLEMGQFNSGMGALSSVGDTLSLASNMLKQVTMAQAMPDNLNGSIECADVLAAKGRSGVYIECISARKEFLERIDNYFDMFGYACGKVKVPNIAVRRSWTYTKTVNCSLNNAELPVTDEDKIKSVFNHGIRFWISGKIVNDYTQDNRTS